MSSSLHPYPAYRPARADWLKEVPQGWQEARLGGLFGQRNEKVSDTEFAPLSVTKDGIVPQIETAAKTNAGDNRKLVRAGDFVINSRSDRKGSAGVSDRDGSVSLISIVLAPRAIEPRFAHHLLRSVPFQEEFYRYGKGIVADLWSTNYSEMKNIVLPLPAVEEQRIIATFLDHETARIDSLIEKQERLIELLKEKRQALVGHASLDISATETRLEHVVDIQSRPVALKDNREYTALGLYNRGRGLFHKESCLGQDMGGSEFFWIRDGDLILSGQFAWEGSVALAGAKEDGCVVSHRYPVIRGRSGVALTEYLWALFTTQFGDFLLNESSRGSAGRNRPLNIGALLKEKINLPGLRAQRLIAQVVENEQALLPLLAYRSDLAKERRSALISAVVTGKIDVRDWTPAEVREEKTATL